MARKRAQTPPPVTEASPPADTPDRRIYVNRELYNMVQEMMRHLNAATVSRGFAVLIDRPVREYYAAWQRGDLSASVGPAPKK